MWTDFFWHNFYSKNSDVISFHLLSALFIFSQAPAVKRSGKFPSTKWKRNHIPPFSLLVVFSYGWERGQHRVNAPLKHCWNPALRIYIMHCPCQGSLYRHALTRDTCGCLESAVSSFSHMQSLRLPVSAWTRGKVLDHLVKEQVSNMLFTMKH